LAPGLIHPVSDSAQPPQQDYWRLVDCAQTLTFADLVECFAENGLDHFIYRPDYAPSPHAPSSPIEDLPSTNLAVVGIQPHKDTFDVTVATASGYFRFVRGEAIRTPFGYVRFAC
jgi:hypothetical protein